MAQLWYRVCEALRHSHGCGHDWQRSWRFSASLPWYSLCISASFYHSFSFIELYMLFIYAILSFVDFFLTLHHNFFWRYILVFILWRIAGSSLKMASFMHLQVKIVRLFIFASGELFSRISFFSQVEILKSKATFKFSGNSLRISLNTNIVIPWIWNEINIFCDTSKSNVSSMTLFN